MKNDDQTLKLCLNETIRCVQSIRTSASVSLLDKLDCLLVDSAKKDYVEGVYGCVSMVG